MPCEFSINHYRELLQLAKDKGYLITKLMDWEPRWYSKCISTDYDGEVLLIRHDVDFSLEYAQQMAWIEVQEGVKSTYHIMLQSEYYNALIPENMKIIRYISDLGHEIGYHIDSKYMIKDEYKMLEKITGKMIRTYSRHFPLVSTSPRLSMRKFDSAEDININIKIKYLSDSCRNWREGCLCQNLGKYDKIQCLMHPVWYCSNTNNRREAIEKVRQNIRFNVDNNIKAFHDQVPDYLQSISISS